tara:strand:- start:1469 stop:2758 length:1290 start_codon:yes stop_codon:yes gene_type:complete
MLFGFYSNENLTGGAIRDFGSYVQMLNIAKKDLFEFFNIFSNLSMDHSPFYFALMSVIQSFFDGITLNVNTNTKIYHYHLDVYGAEYGFLRLFYLHLSVVIPLIFYFCLKEKYKELDKNILFLISLFILISPCFRSYAIWAGDLNLALLFLLLGIFFYLKFTNELELKNQLIFIFLNVLFVALAAYVRPIYSLFSIFFFYKIFLLKGLSKQLILFCLINVIFSFPAIYYVFILDNIFFTWANNFFMDPTLVLYSTNILIISSIFLFYLFPFIIIKNDKNIINSIEINTKQILFLSTSFFITIFFIYNFNYSISSLGGGGIFFKASQLLFNNNYLFYFICFFSFLIFSKIFFDKDIGDILLLLVLICLDPDPFVYHKTFDPLLMCIALLLFNNEFFNSLTKENYKKFSVYLISYYFLIFIIYFVIRTSIN